MNSKAFSLFDDREQRLYLTADERVLELRLKLKGREMFRSFCHLVP